MMGVSAEQTDDAAARGRGGSWLRARKQSMPLPGFPMCTSREPSTYAFSACRRVSYLRSLPIACLLALLSSQQCYVMLCYESATSQGRKWLDWCTTCCLR